MSLTQLRAFRPLSATTVTAVTASNQTVPLPGGLLGTRTIRVADIGSDIIYLTFGDANVTTSVATGMPHLANSIRHYTVGPDVTHVAVIGVGVASNMHLTMGEGQN